MPTPSNPPDRRWLRALVAAVLVVGVLLMGGPAASATAGPADPMSGMVMTDGTAAATGALAPATSSDVVLLTGCPAMCGDLLEACLAALTLLVAAASALPVMRRLERAGARSPLSGRARWWVLGDAPPWPLPSLSRLSVLRV